jgi:hypothetical protein
MEAQFGLIEFDKQVLTLLDCVRQIITVTMSFCMDSGYIL